METAPFLKQVVSHVGRPALRLTVNKQTVMKTKLSKYVALEELQLYSSQIIVADFDMV